PAGWAAVYRERLIERGLEAVKARHAQVHSSKMAHGRRDDLGSERQRGDHDPRSDGAIVGPEWGAASNVVEELPFDAVDGSFDPTRSVAGRESPTVLSITHEVHRIVRGIFLLHKGRLPAVFEIVAAAVSHEGVA